MENMENQLENTKNRFNNAIDRNIDELLSFYNTNLYVMSELTNLRNEILNCLLLELYQASIFTTNHFLERLIKVSLIKNHTKGFSYSQADLYNLKIEEAKSLFDNLVLNDSLKLALKNDLINEKQFAELRELKNEMRNPYSHAELAKINKQAPENFRGFMFNIEDVKSKLIKNEPLDIPEPTEINTFSPVFAQLYQEENSKNKAFLYFKTVHRIMLEIQIKLKER